MSKDTDIKTKIYAAAGIPEYWIIDLRNLQLIVFRSPMNEGYQFQETFTAGEISPIAFPDINVAIERLLRD